MQITVGPYRNNCLQFETVIYRKWQCTGSSVNKDIISSFRYQMFQQRFLGSLLLNIVCHLIPQ
jgi:hypothetical protein